MKKRVFSRHCVLAEMIFVNRQNRFNLGEGIQKRVDNFAEEVAAQTQKQAEKAAEKEQKPPAAAPEAESKKEEAPPPAASTVSVKAGDVKILREKTGKAAA